MQKVFDINHISVDLDKKFGSGGEADIFALKGKPEVLFKRYHQRVLDKRGKELQRKIEAMRHIAVFRNNESLSWPKISLYNEHKKWLGYAMQRKSGIKFNALSPMEYKNHIPNMNRLHLVNYLIQFIRLVSELHAQKVMIGDYNLNNIFINLKTNKVILLDCDSFQIETPKGFFQCLVGSPDTTPKEHQGVPFESVARRTVESERFSIAVLIFQVLMNWRHPFDMVGGESRAQNMTKRPFPYVTDSGSNVPQGNSLAIWNNLPYGIRTLFIRTFTTGMDNPKDRATLSEWLKELKSYYQKMSRGEITKDLSGIPASSNSNKTNSVVNALQQTISPAQSKLGSLFGNIFK